MEPTADNQEDPHYDPEEDRTEGNWKIIDLPEMKLPTGEEDEEVRKIERILAYIKNRNFIHVESSFTDGMISNGRKELLEIINFRNIKKVVESGVL